MENESREFDTPFGKVLLTPRPGKLFFRTADGVYLPINRVEYRVRGSLMLKDGEWVPYPDGPLTFNRNSTDYLSSWEEYTRSANARKKFEDKVYPMLREWLASAEAIEALHNAEIADFDSKIADEDIKIRDLEREISRLKTERSDLVQRRANLIKP